MRRRCSCRHCQGLFIPNRYNRYQQRYCSKEECRRVSELEKRRKWRGKKQTDPEFRASEVKRVQEWRKKNQSRCQARDRKQKPASQQKSSTGPDLDNLSGLRDLLHRQSILLTGIASQLLAEPGMNLQGFLDRCYERGRQYQSSVDLSNSIAHELYD